MQLSLGGDGVGPACEEDDRQIPALTQSEQGVWLTNLYSPTEYPWLTVLCLSGFSTSQPIEVSLAAGTYGARTRVVPVAGPPVQNVVAPHDEESPRTLFQNGASLKVYSTDYGGSAIRGPNGVLVSEMWEFTPPPAARQQIAMHEAITLTATQGTRIAVTTEPVRTPTSPRSWVVPLDGPGSTNRLVLHGYPAGQVVPVGLYRRDESTDPPKAALLEQAGTVRVPASRVAEFAVPDRLVLSHGPGSYCVLPPIPPGQSDCPRVVVWPDYPGRVSPGDTGPAVRQWQKILIAAGWIPDTAQNHDGVYGPKTAAAVTRVFEQYVNPDGGLTLGKGAYRLFTAHVVP